jgi:serine/threonine-protein kinase
VSAGETQAEHPMIYKLSPRGEILLAFGSYGLEPGTFLRPVALAAAPDGTLLVLDAETHLVQRFDNRGALLSSFGGQGGGEGRFNDPRDLLLGARGDLFVLDYGNRQVQRLSPEGNYENCWAVCALPEGDVVVSDRGVTEGRAAGVGFGLLTGFALNHLGELYLAEGADGRVYRVFPSRAEGNPLGLGRCAAPVKPVGPATLDAERLLDLGVDELGNLFCAWRGGQTICKYAPDGTFLAATETYAPIVQLRLDVRS